MKPIKYVFLHRPNRIKKIHFFSLHWAGVMMKMKKKKLVVLVHIKNNPTLFLISVQNLDVCLYVCFSFAVKFMCVCSVQKKQQSKREDKKKRDVVVHTASENEQFCVQYLHHSKKGSFLFSSAILSLLTLFNFFFGIFVLSRLYILFFLSH